MKKKNPPLIDKDKALRNMLSTDKFGEYFGVSQEILDKVWKDLTSPDRNSTTYISMEIGADIDVFNPVRRRLLSIDTTDSTDSKLDYFTKRFLYGPEKIPNYSGGLGVLAGDTLKSFADCKIPVAAISLLYKKGYFSQLVDSKIGQIVWSPEWHPEITPSLYLLKDPKNPGKPLEIAVPFFDRKDRKIMTYAKLWLKMEINDNLDFFVPQILLDYSTESSPDWIQEAAEHLYDSTSEKIKAIQRRLLGAGIIPAMNILGITSKTIHLNEQHGVVVVLHLIAEQLHKKYGDDYQLQSSNKDITDAAGEVAKQIVYTIHTPVKAGHDRFTKSVYKELGHSFCQRVLLLLAEDKDFPESYNFTSLAMTVNRATNSVSRLHKEVTKKQFSQFADKITAITNGVHHLTWISDAKAELYDGFAELDDWRQDPSAFTNAQLLLDNKKFITYFEGAMAKDNETLIKYVNEMLVRHRNQMQETWIDPPNFLSHLDEIESSLKPGVFTIGFARRFSTYKRADLIFEDIDALAEIICKDSTAVNFIFAGKAHPSDEPGKYLIKMILDCQKELFTKTNGLAKLVFIPGYDMQIAKMMVAGVHAWLNSPKRPLEASGTSGMKAAMNGIPNISIMDGWWEEGYQNGKTGWKFGYESALDETALSESQDSLFYEEDSISFYKLFPKILQAFYDDNHRHKYINKCVMNLVLNATKFNTHRMTAEYVSRYNLNLPPATEKILKKFRGLHKSDK
ncbi:MAG: alpha-glucan family phosphorylase [Proteobacteria bacterium]|nr:alpha-glucan family phosphorylase [Pseudomonadota bacterium]MBU1711311.1 alpha-glucan family phosphorylase [Pseudomonadota bacterium]